MSVLIVQSHYGVEGSPYEAAVASGRAVLVRERDLTRNHFDAAKGLITTTHLDQIGFMAWREATQALLARGGCWFFNGHILRELVPGLQSYIPLKRPRRADYVLTRLFEHPIFAGIDQRDLEENKGVAGFYGRGHNPLPKGAVAVNGIGPDLLPIDWDWPLPGGGRMFSHAGNDLGGMGSTMGHNAVLTDRILAWTEGAL